MRRFHEDYGSEIRKISDFRLFKNLAQSRYFPKTYWKLGWQDDVFRDADLYLSFIVEGDVIGLAIVKGEEGGDDGDKTMYILSMEFKDGYQLVGYEERYFYDYIGDYAKSYGYDHVRVMKPDMSTYGLW